MDRREALKKLGAGGAIALGGSMVLSSNVVAQTISQCVTAPANPFAVTRVNSNRRIRLTDNSVALVPGGTPGYAWRIDNYSRQGAGRRILVSQVGAGQVVLGSTNNNYDPVTVGGFDGNFVGQGIGFTISRGAQNGTAYNLKADTVATYSLSVLVTWEFTNGCDDLVAEYTITGAGRAVPTVSPA